jgi:hypothetical protein
MNNPNSKILDEIKEKIEKGTVSEIEESLKKELKTNLSGSNGGNLTSKLDPKVKEEVGDLLKDSEPVTPKNNKNAEQEYNQDAEKGYSKNSEQGYNKGKKNDRVMNRENQMASDLNRDKRGMSNKIDDDLSKKNLPLESVQNKSEGREEEKRDDVKSEDDKAQELNAEKKADGKEKSGKGKIDVEEKVEKASKIKLFFNKLLKESILNTITTFSLSLFYAYIHSFLSDQFSQFFCKPGEEWVPDEIQKSNPEEAKKIGDKLKIEKPALYCACIMHLLVIVCVIALIYFVLFPRVVAWNWLVDNASELIN